uniref:Uncharacterized protein n=1 Tax=viral metagenome TaxID=1070528 RepID=A0A6M3Y245_9ZZZZ
MYGYKKYRQKAYTELRPYIEDENLSEVSVSETDSPSKGGMIARNPDKPQDMWYVNKEYFDKNYEQIS